MIDCCQQFFFEKKGPARRCLGLSRLFTFTLYRDTKDTSKLQNYSFKSKNNCTRIKHKRGKQQINKLANKQTQQTNTTKHTIITIIIK
jgi:hypothetical protein